MENESLQGATQTVYEIGYLVLPSIPEENLSGVVDSIKALVKKASGHELDSETPFKYDLAYTMAKTVGQSRYVVKDAYLGWLKFELESGKVAAVKAGLEKINELLRFILIKAPRETTFTFAQALAKMAEKENASAPAEEAVAVKEPVLE